MRGLNKVQIIGRLGAEPQITITAAGVSICNISVATSEQWRDSNGELRESTEWHRIAMFGKLAEVAGKYLKKGSTVYVEGKLKTQKYTDQNGIERWSTSIHAEQMQMLNGKADAQQDQTAEQQAAIGSQQANEAAQTDEAAPFNQNTPSNTNLNIAVGGPNDPTAVHVHTPQEPPKETSAELTDIPFFYISNQLVSIV